MDVDDVGTVEATDSLATALSVLRDRVISIWLVTVRNEIAPAARLDERTLANDLPLFYDDLTLALTEGRPRSHKMPGTSIAYAHGRDRANLTDYTPSDVVLELQIFHEVILAVAESEGLRFGDAGRAIVDTSTTLEIGQTFLASLSHDIRNPLNVVSSYTQLIRRKTSDADIAALTLRMNAQLAEVDAMLQTLLDAAVMNGRHKLNLNIAEFDLKALAEETCADMPSQTNRYVISGEPTVGFWCRSGMKRALQNLLSNAQKYGQAGTAITVGVARAGSRVLVSVHNDGPSIAPEDMQRMFSAFQRLGAIDVQGWGLGLPFVRNVAESHTGTVYVDSSPERGTTFTICVPLDCRHCQAV
jgi:signal transduction histidine kinase